jgi:membrane-associated protease RseP (regulator of RpoE activity)
MIVLIISLIISIILHEGAHFFATIRSKCGVTIVSLGFGKPIFKFVHNKITYQICWILLGGYVALCDELNYSTSKQSFTNLTYSRKCYIVLAGIAVNCIVGLLALGLDYFFNNANLFIFGWISIMLGLSNLIVIIPGIDGSYPLLFLLEKALGKREGLLVIKRAVEVGSVFINWLNIYVIFYSLWYFKIEIVLWMIKQLMTILTFLIK